MSLNSIMPISSVSVGLIQSQKLFQNSVESIASGYNSYVSPADSYIASGLDTMIRSLKKANENAQLGYNFTAVADSALSNVTNSLQRIQELSIQASNGLYSESQRQVIQDEINQHVEQINQTFANATFNGKPVLNPVTPENPDALPDENFLVGASGSEVISYDPNMNIRDFHFDVSTPENATASLENATNIINDINAKRGYIGAVSSRLESVMVQNNSSIHTASASLSSIQDTDYVSAIVDLKKAVFAQNAWAKLVSVQMNIDSYVLDLV